MRTYNKGNTSNVKQARKQSKELRKLKSNRNTFIEASESIESITLLGTSIDDVECVILGSFNAG